VNPLRPGDLLDHYRVDGVVARSSMASIYRAADERTGLRVAIKIPHPEMEADPILAAQFHEEIEITRNLDHPGVPKVLDAAGTYLVMEWVEGRSLREILAEEGKLQPGRAARIMAGICASVDHLHSRHIVHHDLKPENIILARDGRTMIIDFGIATNGVRRHFPARDASEAMGTPDYISPEQAQGKPGDARSDLYALGVMLYEMVTGRVPFHGPDALAVINDRLRSDPVPAREIDPGIPEALQQTVSRALERDPKRRFANAREFARSLSRQPRSPSPWNRPALRYGALTLIPVILFGLLLYASRLGL
jgi:serine/threonine protein kinase